MFGMDTNYTYKNTDPEQKGNYAGRESFKSLFNRTRRQVFARWLDDPTLTVAMTLNFNPRPFRNPKVAGDGAIPVFNAPITLKNAKQAIGRCFAKVDRNLLGRQFTRDRARRITGVFVFEHAHSNLHAHGLLRVRPDRIAEFAQMFPPTQRGIWTEVWVSGSQWTTFAHDPGGFADYFAKEQRASSAPDAMFFLEDFFPPEG
jgi:hypothetical protein